MDSLAGGVYLIVVALVIEGSGYLVGDYLSKEKATSRWRRRHFSMLTWRGVCLFYASWSTPPLWGGFLLAGMRPAVGFWADVLLLLFAASAASMTICGRLPKSQRLQRFFLDKEVDAVTTARKLYNVSAMAVVFALVACVVLYGLRMVTT